MFSVRRLLVAAPSALAIAAGAVLVAPVAQADVSSTVDLSACNTNSESQPFLPWVDSSYYELAPGGTFSDSSWSLSGGASIVPGAEPWGASGSVSSSSLSLPPGSSAQSPTTCDDAAYPTLRYFIGGTGTVAVSIVDGSTVIPAGTATASGAWAPSPVAVTSAAVTGATNGGTTQVSLQFTSVSGDPQISDVFIDPWRTG